MEVVKPPLRLDLNPRPSRLGAALIVSTHAATATLAIWLPLPWALRLIALAAIVFSGTCGVRRIAGSGLAQSMRIGLDRRLSVTTRDGHETSGDVLDDSYVGPRITTIAWRPDGARRARTLLVLADTFAADDFRRLRVVLRYSRASVPAEGSSEDTAG
jgi:hypothetical protein